MEEEGEYTNHRVVVLCPRCLYLCTASGHRFWLRPFAVRQPRASGFPSVGKKYERMARQETRRTRRERENELRQGGLPQMRRMWGDDARRDPREELRGMSPVRQAS